MGCAAPTKTTTTRATHVGTARLHEQWAPERGVHALSLARESNALVLRLDAIRVCRVWEAEKQFHERTWESRPDTAMLVGEGVMVGTGLTTVAAVWATSKDDCGSGDVLGSCDETVHGIALTGAGLALAGTAALTVHLLSSGKSQETTTELGRAIPPHFASCKQESYAGRVVHLVGPNLTLTGRLNDQGLARFTLPATTLAATDGSLDLDVVVDDRVLGRVVVREEAP